MATLLLGAAGAALGGMLGATGAIVGQAAGALAGGLIDQLLFGGGGTKEVGRIADLEVQTSTEGTPIPRLYGRVRVAGSIIWATRFEEESKSSGGKAMGPKVKSYSYFANFAVALCEGPIAHIGRVWANGELLDTTRVMMRVHRGGEGQAPDSLITAKQGEDNAPAYRGVAYVVFERLPLADFGNTLPQLTFEVIRPVGRLEKMIRAVTLIPGATEYGYSTGEIQREPEEGAAETENRHATQTTVDIEASLDELQAVCPNLESVAVVVSWFGDDLRAAHCQLRPKVEFNDKNTTVPWRVASLTRSAAQEVSRVDGKVAYGGTPSDDSVIEVIKALKGRGLKVTFYPFIMMDVPPGNSLPNPYGGASQPVFPWRGRITCSPAPGETGSPDGTATAGGQIADFLGGAELNDFAVVGGSVSYSGPAEWSFRRMTLHYAHLCKAAGGVDTFLVGSELRGLTTVRDENDYPFVTALVGLAGNVKALLGSGTEVSYAADWTEYFGHQPPDENGDITFHLDKFWAHPAVDFVGIDAYLPLSDWRDGPHEDEARARSPYDLSYLSENVASGELFDWYYANETHRRKGLRTPITDGLAGKPWVYRIKDFAGWWGNRHYNRQNGVESQTPTAWKAGMKPLRFTEIGCPAADFGANQPNVFPDRLSSEGLSPYFSHGTRDDAMQRRYLEALLGWFDPLSPGFQEIRNPKSPLDGRRMMDVSGSHVWTWDARPYPWFPLASEIWSDGPNWETGHWLNGRLGAVPLGAMIEHLLKDCGVAVDASGVSAVVEGLEIPGRGTARDLIEPLAEIFRFIPRESGKRLEFCDRDARSRLVVTADLLADRQGDPLLQVRRAEEESVPTEVAVTFRDGDAEGRQTTVVARRDGRLRATDIALPVTAPKAMMQGVAEAFLKDLEDAREQFDFALPPTRIEIEAGDTLMLVADGRPTPVFVTRIEDADSRRIEARRVDPYLMTRARRGQPSARQSVKRAKVTANPAVVILDLPAYGKDLNAHHPYVAATAKPWPGAVDVLLKRGASFIDAGSVPKSAAIGKLATPLQRGPLWVFDRVNSVEVSLTAGTLSAISEEALLAGGNLAAIGTEQDGFELVQFMSAQLIGERRYHLSTFLRGQGGTEARADQAHPAGARFVLLDKALGRIAIDVADIALPQTLRIGPTGRDAGDPAMKERTLVPWGVGLRPYAPVHVRARRIWNDDVILSWVRRSRLGGDDFQAYEIPLGEDFEAYEVLVRLGATVKRTLPVIQPTAIYTKAMQIEDFGLPPNSIDLAVRQISAAVGPGAEARRIFNV